MLSQAGTGFSLSLDDGLERLHLLLFNKLPHTLSGLNNIHHLLSLKSLWVDWDQLGGSSRYMASFWSREVWLDGNIREGYLYLTWLTQWTWVWVNSGSWWWTRRPGMLQSVRLQRVGHDWATELKILKCGLSLGVVPWGCPAILQAPEAGSVVFLLGLAKGSSWCSSIARTQTKTPFKNESKDFVQTKVRENL